MNSNSHPPALNVDPSATLIATDRRCDAHDPGPGHPETPERVDVIAKALIASSLPLRWSCEPEPVDLDILAYVHAPEYIEDLRTRLAGAETVSLTSDTRAAAASLDVARRAAGAVCIAVSEVLAGTAPNAFCLVRPPGHHAHRRRAGGYCLLNNVALGAAYARRHHHVRRVAIVDFDVHHGDGTQSIFWNDPDTLFISLHQSPYDPWTGSEDERGSDENILNIPLAAGSTGDDYRRALEGSALPRLAHFSPDLLIVSAGFDGHRDDPLGGHSLTAADYGEIGRLLRQASERSCNGRLVSVLEGGYNLKVLGESVAAFVAALAT